jgi:hypothetical protein
VLYWLQKNTSLWRYVFPVLFKRKAFNTSVKYALYQMAESNITLNDGLKLMDQTINQIRKQNCVPS